MMTTRSLTPVILIVAVLVLTGACSRLTAMREGSEDTIAAIEAERSDFSNDLRLEIDSLIGTMTLEEKAAQTLLPAIYASDDAYTLKAVGEYGRMGVGGLVLLKGDSRSARELSDSLRNASRLIPFMSIDAEWGLAMRLSDAKRLPANSEIADTVSETEMFEYGRELARECREIGINMVLGPVVDVAAPGSYMGRRSYGPDPKRVSDLAVAYARGLESGGVVSVAKHFPGHGAASGDSHRKKPVIERSLHALDSIDLYPFRRYIEENLSAVMVGHLALPAVDSEMHPAALSRVVITDLLIKELRFRGLVLTDALNMGGAEGLGASAALEAGADMVLAPIDTRSAIREIVTAVEEGRLSEAELDRKVRKILEAKYKLEKS